MPEIPVLIEEIKKGMALKVDVEKQFHDLQESLDNRTKAHEDEVKQMQKSLDDAESKRLEMEEKFDAQLTKMSKQLGIVPNFKAGGDMKEFSNLGEFTYKSIVMHDKDAENHRIVRGTKSNIPQVKALSGETGEDGGYLVPTQFSTEVMSLALSKSIVRPNGAIVIPMTSREYVRPYIKNFDQRKGYQFGGMVAYWIGESTTITTSEPEFGEFRLEARKLAGMTLAPNELTEDAVVSMGSELTAEWSQVIAWMEDEACIRGDGVKKPVGIINADCAININRTTATTVVADDLIDMWARLYGNGVWLINQGCKKQIVKLKDENNNWIWWPGGSGSDASSKLPTNLFGMPINWTDKASALGEKGDVILSDFSHYRIGDRKAMSIETSRERYFEQDVTAWRVIQRMDGKPWLPSAITPANGADQLSPFVILDVTA